MSEVQPEQFGRVAVLMGGISAEREISLKSGKAVLAGLLNQGVKAEGIDVDRHILQTLSQEKFDRAFIALHGYGGEDGIIQGILEFLQIPYTGSGVLASALGMNKFKTKQIWKSIDIPTPNYKIIDKEEQCLSLAEEIGLPLMIKPLNEGSSIGMSKVSKVEDIIPAWQKAQHHGQVMAETFVTGKEYTASILEDKALPLIHVEANNVFYDYEAKYFSNETRYFCPTGLPEALEQRLQEQALKAFAAIGAKDWGRVDFLLDQDQNPWFIEVNTIPGMTDHSLVPMAAKHVDISFDELVVRILATTLN